MIEFLCIPAFIVGFSLYLFLITAMIAIGRSIKNDIEKSDIKKNSISTANRGEILEQLKIINNSRTETGHESWNIFGIFWAANAVLLVGLFQNTEIHISTIQWIVIPVFGIALSTIWFLIECRALGWLEHWEDQIKEFENYLNYPEKFKTIGGPSGIPMRPIMRSIPVFGVIFWWVMLLCRYFIF